MDVKITINFNGKQEEITVYQAKKLYNELHTIFGSSTTTYPDYPGIWEPFGPVTCETYTYQGQYEDNIITSKDAQGFIDWCNMEEWKDTSNNVYDKWYAQD